jgi:hypothetical protein
MYYCDLGREPTSIRTLNGIRTVGRYVMVDTDHIPQDLAYNAHTIVSRNTNEQLKWYKNRDRENSALLTEAEQKQLMVQILKSEKW